MTAVAINGTELIGNAIKASIQFVKQDGNSLSSGDPQELRRHEQAFKRNSSISSALFSLAGSVIQDISDKVRIGTNKRNIDFEDSSRYGAAKDMFFRFLRLGLYQLRASEAIDHNKITDGQEVVVVKHYDNYLFVHGKGTKIKKDELGNWRVEDKSINSKILIGEDDLVFSPKVEGEVNKQLSMIWDSALRDFEDAFSLAIKEEKAKLNPKKSQRKTIDKNSIERAARLTAEEIIKDINSDLDSAEKLIRDDLTISYTKGQLIESIEDAIRRNEIPDVSLQDIRTLMIFESIKAGDEVVRISELSDEQQKVYKVHSVDAEGKGKLLLRTPLQVRTDISSTTEKVIKVETLDKIKAIIKEALVANVDRQRNLLIYEYTEALIYRRNSLKLSLSNIVKKIFGVKPDGREEFREAVRIRSAESEVLRKLQVPFYVKYKENALPVESFRDGQEVIVVGPETYLLEEGVRLVQRQNGRWMYRVYRNKGNYADFNLDPEYLVFDPLQSHVIDESVEALAKGAIEIFHTTLEKVLNQEEMKRAA